MSDDSILPELKPGRYIVLRVSDTGCGIEPELIDAVFDPFFTTKPRGEGTGMGLALVYSIANNHQGAVQVESARCEGATFTVYFPAVYRQAAEQAGLVEELPTGSEAVLFVDDEEMLSDLGPKMLESLGYRVTSKKSSSEALEEFKKNPRGFDLVITDQSMPGKTGFEIAQEMLLIRPDLPVILCTGFSQSVPEETARARGIRQYLLKPYGRKQLAETVRRALDSA
jgi:CheY-like chemotaxis protein